VSKGRRTIKTTFIYSSRSKG